MPFEEEWAETMRAWKRREAHLEKLREEREKQQQQAPTDKEVRDAVIERLTNDVKEAMRLDNLEIPGE
jgi:hypothetical protein